MRLLRTLATLSLVQLTSLSLVLAEKDPSAPDPRKQAVADDDSPKDTTFNGQTVPPIAELNGAKFDQEIAKGHWLVEAFSPYCGHCKHLAPKWQTLYEFYYTSDPLPASRDDGEGGLNSFSRYYDFKFGKLDCVAFADACTDHGVGMFPTLLFFKEGKLLKNQTGDLASEKLSDFIEESLEIIRPGSRPAGGVVLPEVGAKGTGKIEGKEKESEGSGVMKPANRKPENEDDADEEDDVDEADKKKKKKKPATPHEGTKLVPDKAAASPPRQSLGSGARPNPLGKSLPLSPDNFTSTVVESLDPWFVKFYAPWCHHCQALAPSWSTMADTMKDQLNIAEVNCDAEKRLCRENGVKYYPTLQLIRGREKIEYTGLRGLGDLEAFAKSAASDLVAGVPDVTLAEFEAFHDKHPVTFIYFYDHATTSEDFMALERLPLHILGKARLVKSSDDALASKLKVATRPRLVVSRDGRVSQYEKLMPKEMRDVDALTTWMRANWLPLVPELDSSNAHDIMQHKFAVLTIMDKTSPTAWTAAAAELKSAAAQWGDVEQARFASDRDAARAAKQAKLTAAEQSGKENKVVDAKLTKIDPDALRAAIKPVAFALVDARFWERWLRGTFDVRPASGAQTVVYDYDRRRFWGADANGEPLRPRTDDLVRVLELVTKNPPGIKSTIVGSGLTYWPFLVWYLSKRHPLWAGGLVLAALVGYAVRSRWGRKGTRRGTRSEKEGLLGMTRGGGKAD